MSLHHKNCGGVFEIGGFTDYGEGFGVLPDFYCNKCGDFLAGDAQVQETIEELQMRPICNQIMLVPKPKKDS